MADPKKTVDHIVLRGDAFARGLSYGRQCSERIAKNLHFYKDRYTYLDWDRIYRFIDDNYMRALRKYYPSALKEMEGLAEGSGISLPDILFINSRYELMRWNKKLLKQDQQNNNNQELRPVPKEGCTSGVCLSSATETGDVLIGQNWDNNKRMLFDDMLILLEVYPEEQIPAFFTLTEVGQLARIGMNANGLGITGMSLFSSDDHFGEDSANGYLPISLLRRMFIEAPTFAVGLKRILSVPRHVSINMTAVSGEAGGEAVNIEMTPKHHFVDQPSISTDIYAHSNRFKSLEFMANPTVDDTYIDGSSLYRDRQFERLMMKSLGKIDEQVLEQAFKDHKGFPDGVCLHLPEKGRQDMATTPNMCTIACIICNLTKRTIRMCRGPPCLGQFQEYSFTDN